MNDADPHLMTLFAAALDCCSEADRAAYLDRACGPDRELRKRVVALLRAHDQAGRFLELAPAGAPSTVDAAADTATGFPVTHGPATGPETGQVIAGRYTLLEMIGEGGMGTVYLARQAEPVKRLVAVKVIKAGMDTTQLLVRFEAERQALAVLDHPHIAKVFDGGSTADGRPFFVMELVNGVPITTYCDEHRLMPRQRLELFVPVCQAIQHAHQKGIIHRDLKPSNVLVGLYDEKPVPKVIDFGVAKPTGGQLTEQSLHTNLGAVVGTINYMSPEQATFNHLDVDTRSDIYSLGVLLYELLTGTTPLDRKQIKETPLLEVLRIIREGDMVRPSTRLGTMKELQSIAANRGLEPKKLSGVVRGELDWIVMKALDKDRNRRYETANGLAMDVHRYLADEPVLACPPSAGYRLRKFVRRNRSRLTLTTALGLLLLGAGAFALYSDRHAAQRQDRHVQNAEAVAALLDQCKEALRADRADRAVLALGAAERRAADGGAEKLTDRLARCRADLGLLRVLDNIDDLRWTWDEQAFPDLRVVAGHWRTALTGYGATADEDRAAEAAARINESAIRDRILTALDEWLAIDRLAGVRAVLQCADPDSYRDAVRDAVAANDRKRLADLAGQPDAMLQPPRFATVLGRLSGVPTDRGRDVLQSALRARTNDLVLLMSLGNTYSEDRLEGAGERMRWFQAALAARPGNLAALNNLGIALRAKGDLSGAIAVYREAIRLDPKFARAHANLGVALKANGDLDEAIAAYREAIRFDPNYDVAHYNLGNALKDTGDPDEAIACLREAIGINPKYAKAHNELGLVLKAKGDGLAAIASFRRAIWADPNHANAHCNLGNALQARGDPDAAIACFKEAIRLDPRHANAHRALGDCQQARGDLVAAIASFKEAVRADPKYAAAHNNLGFALQARGDPDAAIACFKEAIRVDPTYAIAHFNLGKSRRAKRDPDGAIASFKEAIRLDPKFAPAYVSLGAILCNVKRDYEGAIAAFKEALRAEPKYVSAHINLGFALRAKGDPDGAIASYREAIRLDPRNVNAQLKLGAILCDVKRDYDGAIAAFKEAIRLDANDGDAQYNLALALRAKGDLDGAITAFKESIRLDPQYAPGYVNLGMILCDEKREYDAAIAAFRQAIRLNPKYRDAHDCLGVALIGKGDAEGAIAAYTEAIRLDPKYANVRNNLAWLLATGPDRVRDGKRSVEHATRACELTEWKNPDFISTLAAAHAEAGEFDRAIEFEKKALSFKSADEEIAIAGEKRLQLYSKKRPYRDLPRAPNEIAPPPREVKP